jgi:hypothetical protein
VNSCYKIASERRQTKKQMFHEFTGKARVGRVLWEVVCGHGAYRSQDPLSLESDFSSILMYA